MLARILRYSVVLMGFMTSSLFADLSDPVPIQFGPERIITIPKTGTNLILKLIFLIDNAHGIDCDAIGYQNEYRTHRPFWSHEWRCSSLDERSIGPTDAKVAKLSQKGKVIIILRDPRSLMAAMIPMDCSPEKLENSVDELIDHPEEVYKRFLPNVISQYHSFTELYEDYMRWAEYPFTYVTRFEKLVGPEGGGNREDQIVEIMSIANHIDKPVSYAQACTIADKLFGGTSTFRTGQIDTWKEVFTQKQYDKFLSKEKELLEKLGYLP